MNRARMMLLDDVLARVETEYSPIGFDMESWITGPVRPTACGTTACAGGHLCLDPRAQADGLNIIAYGSPIFEELEGYAALEKYLDISKFDALYLFSPDEYYRKQDDEYDIEEDGAIPVRAVRRHVKELLEGGGWTAPKGE